MRYGCSQIGENPESHGVSGRRLAWTIGLNFFISIAEGIGGVLTGSLSLIGDALHNLSDGLAVILSYTALRLSRRKSTALHTFGLRRAEVLSGFINAAVLVSVSVYLLFESLQRFSHPSTVDGPLMAGIGALGLVANTIGTLLLHDDAGHSMNIRSAYLHLLSDAASSLAVVLGGIAIAVWDITWVDPILTILIGLYILRESGILLHDAVHVLMEGTPEGIDLDHLVRRIEELEPVHGLHHLHVWTVGEHEVHFQAHVEVDDMLLSESARLRATIERILSDEFRIRHVTLQMECVVCENLDRLAEYH